MLSFVFFPRADPKEPLPGPHGRRAHSSGGLSEGRGAGYVQKPAPGCGLEVSAHAGLLAVLASAAQTRARDPGSLFKSTPNPADVSLQPAGWGGRTFLLWMIGLKQKVL